VEADSVIIAPVLTEKTNAMRETESRKYVFKVNPRANKFEVMKAIHELFSVNPLNCRVINVKQKPRMARTKSGFRLGHTASWKKAIITLPKGEKIDLFEGV
jgi:large subunit ribosomal protein L23